MDNREQLENPFKDCLLIKNLFIMDQGSQVNNGGVFHMNNSRQNIMSDVTMGHNTNFNMGDDVNQTVNVDSKECSMFEDLRIEIQKLSETIEKNDALEFLDNAQTSVQQGRNDKALRYLGMLPKVITLTNACVTLMGHIKSLPV